MARKHIWLIVVNVAKRPRPLSERLREWYGSRKTATLALVEYFGKGQDMYRVVKVPINAKEIR